MSAPEHPLKHSVFPPTIEIALNRFLAMNPDAITLCQQLNGRVIAVLPKEIGLPLFFAPAGDRIQVLGDHDGKADATLTASTFDFARAKFSENGWLEANIQIDGDVSLGQQFGELLQVIDFDLEEPLSRLVGDVAAHQIGEAARGLLTFGQSLFSRTASRAVATGAAIKTEEVELFCDDVDIFRDDVARLDARINRMDHSRSC